MCKELPSSAEKESASSKSKNFLIWPYIQMEFTDQFNILAFPAINVTKIHCSSLEIRKARTSLKIKNSELGVITIFCIRQMI